MARVLLDPLIFAAPSSTATIDEFGDYLERLLELERLEKSDCIHMAVSIHAVDALSRADAYPMVERYPRDHFNALTSCASFPDLTSACHMLRISLVL
jgi:hypothetical protein